MLVDEIMGKIRGNEVVCLDAEWPSYLNGAYAKLFHFIMTKINSTEQLTKLDKKDLFVVMSGIVNARMDGSLDILGQQFVDRTRGGP
ncbi:hypothetical protein BGZ97_009822 [Linnemannia gamsii]|uniref:Uncharacterized protein n=1 Tax=Linnemannia gamsii TaxID=64522 RepID=A0A9P6R9G2_9FUNG|nr:hypothetical protein BGZ97_009822 [Linnemannia gamsii]